MAEGKKSFIAYADWKETFEALPDDKAGQLIKHIFSYVSDENPQSEDILINAVFANIKNTLKRDLKKWDKQREQRVEAGRRSAELRKQSSTTVERPLNENQQASTVSVNDNVNVSVNNIKYIYNQFYDSELKKSNNNKKYEMFIKMLFGENEEKRKLTGILKIENQLTFDNFNKILAIKPNDIFISDILLKIENDSKYYKGKKSLYRTLLNWVNGRFVK